VLAAIVWAVGLYLRGRPLAGGVALGVGTAAKLVAPYALLVVGLFELGRAVAAKRERGAPTPRLRDACGRWLVFGAAAAGVFLGLLAAMDRIAPPYDPNARKPVRGGPFGHIGHMLSFQAHLTSPRGPRGIASYPWQWLGDYKPIVYLNINPSRPAPGLRHIHPAAHFLGMISPPILLIGIPGLMFAAWRLWRARTATGSGSPAAAPGDEFSAPPKLAALALAWFVGTWTPFELLSALDSRTSYLYYMVIVMPGVYVAVVYVFARWRPPRWVIYSYAVLVLVAAIVMYPFTPVP